MQLLASNCQVWPAGTSGCWAAAVKANHLSKVKDRNAIYRMHRHHCPCVSFITTFLYRESELKKELETCCCPYIPCNINDMAVWSWKMDKLAKPQEDFPFDGRHHGNIQRFVCHGVPGRKLIITCALWLGLRQQATLLFQQMQLDFRNENPIDFFGPLLLSSGVELAVCVRRSNKKERKKKKTADGASSSQLTTLTNWLGGRILSCGMKDTIC